MDYVDVLILSLVEGVTEFLPISSTGHLVLTSNLLNIPQSEFVKSFEIIIQLGAILAVLVLYFKKLFNNFSLWLKILAAFIPTAILGLIFYQYIKDYLLGNTAVTLAALFIGGLILIVIELYFKQKEIGQREIEELDYKKAFLIGLFQSISMIPGVSRSASTIIGGLLTGLSRKAAVEFSFLLSIPTMISATGLDIYKSNFAFSKDEAAMLGIGFIGSFITAYFVIKFFLHFVQNHTFIPFGIYRIILSLLFWLIILN